MLRNATRLTGTTHCLVAFSVVSSSVISSWTIKAIHKVLNLLTIFYSIQCGSGQHLRVIQDKGILDVPKRQNPLILSAFKFSQEKAFLLLYCITFCFNKETYSPLMWTWSLQNWLSCRYLAKWSSQKKHVPWISLRYTPSPLPKKKKERRKKKIQ